MLCESTFPVVYCFHADRPLKYTIFHSLPDPNPNSIMGVTPRTQFPRLKRGMLATSFLKFPDLPPEIRALIWRQATYEPRIVRLDLGVDSYPGLLRTCFEIRQLCEAVYLMYKGEIDSTSECPARYRDILPDHI